MPWDVGLSLNEREFILQALREDIRQDGRTLDEGRALKLIIGDDYGLVEALLGHTRYVNYSLAVVIIIAHTHRYRS